MLPSSTEVFYFYGQTLEQCARLRSVRSLCLVVDSLRPMLTSPYPSALHTVEVCLSRISSRCLQSGLKSTQVGILACNAYFPIALADS